METHTERVTQLVLRGIFTLRKSELDWFYEGGAEAVFPDLWEAFIALVPIDDRGNLIDAYRRQLNDPDPAIHGPAAIAWSTWEASTITLLRRPDVVATFADPHHALAFARIENHYFVNKGFFDGGRLIRDIGLLAEIPAVIIQGRYDICTPAVTAWDLHRARPEAEFVLVPDAGHAFDEPGTLSALIDATDRFAEI